MDKWCEHDNVRADCLECRLAVAEARIERIQIHRERHQARRVALMHRLRRYRDRFIPEGTCHTCHADCMHEGCLIANALLYIEGYEDDGQAEV